MGACYLLCSWLIHFHSYLLGEWRRIFPPEVFSIYKFPQRRAPSRQPIGSLSVNSKKYKREYNEQLEKYRSGMDPYLKMSEAEKSKWKEENPEIVESFFKPFPGMIGLPPEIREKLGIDKNGVLIQRKAKKS
jgi:hypothetical protein